MEDLLERTSQTSMPTTPPDSPALPSSGHGERQTPRKGKGKAAGEDDDVTTREQMSKAGGLFQGQDTAERNGFIIEEISDFSNDDEGENRSNAMQPDVIEYAESELSDSHIEGHVIKDLRDLNFRSPDSGPLSHSSDTSDDEYQEVMRQQRAYERKQRRVVSEFKRAKSECSDSDHEDLRHCIDVGQAGSSARRLKRRVDHRRSLIFQDPPPKIDEMSESSDLEDIMTNEKLLAKDLPFYAFTTMEVDSPGASTTDVSRITPSSLQNSEGKERVSEGEELFHGSSSFDTKPSLPPKVGENAKVTDNEEDTRSDRDSDADETMSVQSYADSIFDTGSVGSSASSVFSDTQALVGEYVGFLVRDPGLEKLFMRSLLPTVLGSERFRRNYSRILQGYARDLKRQLSMWNEPQMPLRTQGLAFISRRSITMITASIIASRYMEKAPRAQVNPGWPEVDNADILGENETSSGDECPVNESNHNFMISELAQYFREGAPFQRMKRNLRNLIIPAAVLSRVKVSTERILDLVLGDEYLRFLLFKALSDALAPLRDNQFEPETGIKYFGSRLKAEASSPDHVRLAEFIETYAGYIGTRAIQRMESMDIETILQESKVSAPILCHLRCPDTQCYLFEEHPDKRTNVQSSTLISGAKSS